MNDAEKQSGTKNATILMVLAGVLFIAFGYQYYQLLMVISDSSLIIVAAFAIVFGVITLCTSLVVWFENPWATKSITGAGIVDCAYLVIFGFYLMIFVFVPLFWIARNQLEQVNAHTDWHDNPTGN